MFRPIVVVALALLLSGCATILSGTSQDVAVTSNPAGARCVLSQNGEVVATIAVAPATAHVPKTKYKLDVHCEKDGYEPALTALDSGTDGKVLGNLILGGIYGWAFDSATGADNKYAEQVTLAMTPKIMPVAAVTPAPPAPAEPAPIMPVAVTLPVPPRAEAPEPSMQASSDRVAAAETPARAAVQPAPAPARAATVPDGLEPMNRSARIVKLGYTYATPSDQTDGLALLKAGMDVHIDGKVPGRPWYYISGDAVKKSGYAKAAALTLE